MIWITNISTIPAHVALFGTKMKWRRIVFGLHTVVSKLSSQFDWASKTVGWTAVTGISNIVPLSTSFDS